MSTEELLTAAYKRITKEAAGTLPVVDSQLLASRWLIMASVCAYTSGNPDDISLSKPRELLLSALSDADLAYDELLTQFASQLAASQLSASQPSSREAAAAASTREGSSDGVDRWKNCSTTIRTARQLGSNRSSQASGQRSEAEGQVEARPHRTGAQLWGKAREMQTRNVVCEATANTKETVLSARAARRAAKSKAERAAFYRATQKGAPGLCQALAAEEQRKKRLNDSETVITAYFWSSCAQYFSDNVLVMITAATAGISYGTVGASSANWTPTTTTSLIIQTISLFINLGLMLLIRWVLRQM